MSCHIVSYLKYQCCHIRYTLFIQYVTSHCVIEHIMIMIYLQVYHVGICFIISHIAHTVKRPWVWKELYKSNVLLLLYIISCSVICPMVGLPHISYVIIYCRTMIQHITEISNDHVYVKKDKTAVKHFINTLTLLCSVNSSLCGLSFLSALMVVFLAFFLLWWWFNSFLFHPNTKLPRFYCCMQPLTFVLWLLMCLYLF